MGLRARRDRALGAASTHFAQASNHFPSDDLNKVVATWLLAEAVADGGATLGAARAVAASALVAEEHFRAGAFGGPVADEALAPRAKVRALVRRTRALGDDEHPPGVANSLDDSPESFITGTTTREGAELLCGYITGSGMHSVPPGARVRRRACAFCGRRRGPGDKKFSKCTFAARIFRRDDSRATPRLRGAYSVKTSRGGAAAATWKFV